MDTNMNDDIKTNDLNLANDSNNASEAAEGAQNEVTQERTYPS